MSRKESSAESVDGSTAGATGRRATIALKQCVLLVVVVALLLAPVVGTGGIAGGDPVERASTVPNETAGETRDAAAVQTNGTGDVDYAEYREELEALANVSLSGDEDATGEDAASETLSDEVREAAAAGARDGVRLAEERGVDVTAEREQAAVDGAIRAAAEVEGATPAAIRAAAKGAAHGALLQSQGDGPARETGANATQVRASVYGSAAGALSQGNATATQLQSAAYGAAYGTTARHRNVTVARLRHAAVAASAGAVHGAVRSQRTDVTQIQEAARGGSYGALTQQQTVTVVQVQAAAFGAAGGAAESAGDRKRDPEKVQEAAMGAARGALQGQRASVVAIQAAARGACTGALVQEQRVSVTQIQRASSGAARGAISQHQTASVRQIQAAAFGGAKGVLRQTQRVDVVQIQLAAAGAAKGGASSAAQYQITDVEQIQAAAAGAGRGSVVQIQQVNVRQVQVIAEGAAAGALSQHQRASVVQIQSAARGASEGALSLTQVQIVNVQQIQVISERAAAETVQSAVEVDVTVERTIYEYAKGEGDTKDHGPDLRSLFFEVDDGTLFLANPNDVTVTVTATGDGGEAETITLSPGESLARSFDPGTYTLTADSEDGRTVDIAGRESLTVHLGPDVEGLTATLENGTLTIANPNGEPALVTLREGGDRVLAFEVPPTSERRQRLDPGEYALTARLDGSSVRINGEDEFEFSVPPREVYLDVTVDGREVTVRNPTAADATVTAVREETGEELAITVPAGATRNRTVEPGNYTLVGDTDDPDVFLNGRAELSIAVAEPTARLGVEIVEVTDPVEAGEPITVRARISNDGDEPADGEVTLDIDERSDLDATTVELEPGESESVTLSYRTTEDDVGPHNVTVRSPSAGATEAVEVLDADADGGESRRIDSCTVVSEPGVYEVAEDVAPEGDAVPAEHDDACIRIAASDVVLEGNDNAILGRSAADDPSATIGVLVGGTDETTVENVTIRNLRVEGWDPGIRVGYPVGDGDVRIVDAVVSGNDGDGIHVARGGSANVDAVQADRNGRNGIHVGEGEVGSIANVTANGNGGDGIRVSEGEVGSIADVTAGGNGDSGVSLSETEAVTAERITAVENGGHGIALLSDVYRSEFSGIYAANNDGPGLGLDADSSGNVVRDSTIEDNGGPGIRHGQNGRNEFRNVTVRANSDRQIDTYDDDGAFSASAFRIGEAAEFTFEEEPVSLDAVDRGDLPPLPDDPEAVGDGVEIVQIDSSVDVTLDHDGGDGQVELWRYDGEEWSTVETIDPESTDDAVEATLTEDGIYAPVLIEGDEDAIDLTVTVDDGSVTIENPGDTGVSVTAIDDETGDERLVEVPPDGTVTEEFDPGNYTLSGDAEDDRPVTLNGETDLGITVDASDPAKFVIESVETNDPVEAGETLTVTVGIENVGGATATREVSLDVGDQEGVDTAGLELDGGESGSVGLAYETDGDDAGDLDVTVRTADSTETVEVTVRESEEGEPDDGQSTEEDEGSNDESSALMTARPTAG